jgi:hypothetical protein
MKAKNSNIDPATLPKGKGIESKSQTPGPNFVERGRSKSVWVKHNQGANPYVTSVRDRGTNPGGSPTIQYDREDRFSPAKGKVSIDKMDNRGNFVKSNSMVNTPSVLKRSGAGTTPSDAINIKASSLNSKSASSMPVKNEQLNTIMDKNNKNLKIGNAKKVEKYIK